MYGGNSIRISLISTKLYYYLLIGIQENLICIDLDHTKAKLFHLQGTIWQIHNKIAFFISACRSPMYFGGGTMRQGGVLRSIQFLYSNQPGIEHLVVFLADTAGLLTQPSHHPRIDGGLQPFVLRHG